MKKLRYDQVAYMMYDEPSPSASWETLERELAKVRNWPDSIQNKQSILKGLEETIARKKAMGHLRQSSIQPGSVKVSP